MNQLMQGEAYGRLFFRFHKQQHESAGARAPRLCSARLNLAEALFSLGLMRAWYVNEEH